MSETRWIDDAISLLGRCEAKLGNFARTTDDYNFLKSLRYAQSEAEKELRAIHAGPKPSAVLDYDPPHEVHTECYCSAGNAPCNWCENHCAECEEHTDECACA